MKALSLRQPWAWLVVNGFKTIETRTWGICTDGLSFHLLIHASGKWDAAAKRQLEDDIAPHFPFIKYEPGMSTTGAIVGAVDLLYCREVENEIQWNGEHSRTLCPPYYYSKNKYFWMLGNPIPLKNTVPCKGHLRLWEVPDDIFAEVKKRFFKK